MWKHHASSILFSTQNVKNVQISTFCYRVTSTNLFPKESSSSSGGTWSMKRQLSRAVAFCYGGGRQGSCFPILLDIKWILICNLLFLNPQQQPTSGNALNKKWSLLGIILFSLYHRGIIRCLLCCLLQNCSPIPRAPIGTATRQNW
jgi:hypothetical protein